MKNSAERYRQQQPSRFGQSSIQQPETGDAVVNDEFVLEFEEPQPAKAPALGAKANFKAGNSLQPATGSPRAPAPAQSPKQSPRPIETTASHGSPSRYPEPTQSLTKRDTTTGDKMEVAVVSNGAVGNGAQIASPMHHAAAAAAAGLSTAAPGPAQPGGAVTSSQQSEGEPAPVLFEGDGLGEIGSARKASEDYDDEFDYVFEGKQREGEVHKQVFKSKALPAHLVTNVKNQLLNAVVEEDGEEEQEEEEEDDCLYSKPISPKGELSGKQLPWQRNNSWSTLNIQSGALSSTLAEDQMANVESLMQTEDSGPVRTASRQQAPTQQPQGTPLTPAEPVPWNGPNQALPPHRGSPDAQMLPSMRLLKALSRNSDELPKHSADGSIAQERGAAPGSEAGLNPTTSKEGPLRPQTEVEANMRMKSPRNSNPIPWANQPASLLEASLSHISVDRPLSGADTAAGSLPPAPSSLLTRMESETRNTTNTGPVSSVNTNAAVMGSAMHLSSFTSVSTPLHQRNFGYASTQEGSTNSSRGRTMGAAAAAGPSAAASAAAAAVASGHVDEWDLANQERLKEMAVDSQVMPTDSPASYHEMLLHFMTVDVGNLRRDVLSTLPPAPGFFSRMLCLAPPELTAVLKEQQVRLLSLARLSFNDNDPVHFRLLCSLFAAYTGRYVVQPRYGSHWAQLGFQGQDPATDLRSCGMLGLLHLYYLQAHDAFNAAAIYNLSRDREQEFPMSIVSLNITKWTLQMVREGQLSKYANTIGSLVEAAGKFYVGTFYTFYLMWKKGNKTMTDSGTEMWWKTGT
mmetsp:Transcript_37423/g.83278  ORF Transcript_37423/g.83278 Transcript_37423/m.83278 type:complete len:800 (-) Transcript_37423:69-2468(-)